MSERADDGLEVVASEDGLVVRGEIDLDSTDRLMEAVEESNGRVVLYLDEVTFIDSSGLRGLLRAQQTVRERGDELVLSRPSAVVRRLLEITGLLGEFTIDA